MTNTRHLVVGVTALLLSACGSSPVIEDHYYSLVLAAGDSAGTEVAQGAAAILVISSVQLPAYLERRGLPMQTGPNQITTANHHLWAEPLDEAIAKVLAGDIAARTDGIDVERAAGRHSPEGDCRLRLEFDAFHPTSNSRAVARGRFWIVAGDKSSRHAFNISRTLTTDGYAHAVDRLRETLQSLADQVADELRRAAACTGD